LLAFGDSLTAGYHSQGQSFSPWAPLLCRMLGEGVDAIDHVGMSGFTTGQLLQSADQAEVHDVVPRKWPGLRCKMRGQRYSAVLILCGTNDLADKVPAEQIVSNISALHKIAHDFGARTVAMTIPESHAATKVDWLREARIKANVAIRKWASSQPTSQVKLVDAAALVPYSEAAVRAGLWEFDGLHMSKLGYEKFGRGLHPLVADFVAASELPPLSPSERGSPGSGGLYVGARVRLGGLKSAAHLNGSQGRVLGIVDGSAGGRIGVQLDADGNRAQEQVSVRRENLELVVG
jgi:lysophospholipase L1-like esterase